MATEDASMEPGGLNNAHNFTAQHSEQQVLEDLQSNQPKTLCGTKRQAASWHSAEPQSRLGQSKPLGPSGSVSASQIECGGNEGLDSGLSGTKAQEDNKAVVSFVRAVHSKYQPSNQVMEPTDDIVIIHTSGNIIKTTSSGTISLPKQVSMSGQEISVAGDALAIEKMCVCVTELDLMENNITSWEEVFSIIECIPHLTFLNLTSNCLIPDASSLKSARSRPLPSLTHLVLNNTGVTWDVVAQLLVIFPGLVELHLGFNKYHTVKLMGASQEESSSPEIQNLGDQSTDMETECTNAALDVLDHALVNTAAPISLSQDQRTKDIIQSTLSSNCEITSHEASTLSSSSTCFFPLRRLFFVKNLITDWEDINKLGQYFPNLEYLSLSENKVTDLGNTEDIPRCFPNLRCLGLGHTLLRSWEEVEKLALFPMLSDVRLSSVPFLESVPKHIQFQHTVALLPNITTLNGSKVTESEREDAERAFLRKYMDSDTRPSRYYELEEKYGRLDPLAKVELKPQQTVKLKVRVEDDHNQVVKMEEMDIELDQTVRALRKLLSVMAGKPASKLALFYMDNQIEQGLDRLIYLERKLFAYGMTDGDELIVVYKS